MVHIKLEGYDFEYDVSDVIKLFYKDEEIAYVDSEPPAEDRGIFIFVRIASEGGNIALRVQFKASDKSFVSDISMPAPGDNRHEIRKILKREIKHQIYLALAKHTGRQLPWGTLTGIRPAKIVHELLQEGRNKEEIIGQLTGYFMVSEKKAQLLYDIARVESNILSKTTSDMVSIYIGIPFCPTRCLYCSFTSNSIDKYRHMVPGYMEALKTEISAVGDIIKENGYRIQSVYIGGGTPTSLDALNLKEMLTAAEASFDVKDVEEYTLEAGRPDSIDEDKLAVIRDSRVDRISINPQTMCDETLRLIGRRHTAEDIVKAFNLARKLGFDNINMDVIIGLPGEGIDALENTLREIGKLGPESLTVHTMAVKRASKLNENKDKYSLAAAEEASRMINMAGEYATAMNMHPYYLYRQKNMLGNLENIGYCKPGYESIYNIQIMEEKQTIIALGAGAITKVVYPAENRIERAFNVKGVEEYINRVDEMIERKRALLGK